MNTRNISWR